MENTEKYKNILLEEKEKVEQELKGIGRINPSNPKDWEAIPSEISSEERTEKNEIADKIEGYEENTAILNQLETRLKDINDALEKIEKGTFGICEISGEKIEEDRLEANPAARTCKAHINEE